MTERRLSHGLDQLSLPAGLDIDPDQRVLLLKFPPGGERDWHIYSPWTGCPTAPRPGELLESDKGALLSTSPDEWMFLPAKGANPVAQTGCHDMTDAYFLLRLDRTVADGIRRRLTSIVREEASYAIASAYREVPYILFSRGQEGALEILVARSMAVYFSRWLLELNRRAQLEKQEKTERGK